MATRFYLPASGSVPVTPALDANWERSFTGWTRRPLVRSKSNTALATLSEAYGTTSTQQKAYAQWISETLDVDQTIAGTISMVVGKCAETTTSGDAHLAFSLRVLKPDGTFRGTLLLFHAISTEFALVASAATRIHSARALTSTACLAGDRLVLEIGIHAVTPANEVMQMRFGDPSATGDFALTAALTTDLDPWMELSQNVTFGAHPVTVGAIGSAEAVGAPALTLTTGLQGIASAGAQGAPNVGLTLSPSGIASAEAFGTLTIELEQGGPLTISDIGGIASAEALGSPGVALALGLVGVGGAEAVGTLSLVLTMNMQGIVSVEAIGSPSLALGLALSGVASAENVPGPGLSLTLAPSGVTSSEAVGSPTFELTLAPDGIASFFAAGSPGFGLMLEILGIESAEAIGSITISLEGDLTIQCIGIPSAEALGTITLTGIAPPKKPPYKPRAYIARRKELPSRNEMDPAWGVRRRG